MNTIWFCKIGETESGLTLAGADAPMRKAVNEAYEKITGEKADFTFSGWGAKLNEYEQRIIDKENEAKIL